MFGSKWYWVSNGFSSTSGASTSTFGGSGGQSSNSKIGVSYAAGSSDKKSTLPHISSNDNHVTEKDWQEAQDRIKKLERKIKKLKKQLNNVKAIEPDEL